MSFEEFGCKEGQRNGSGEGGLALVLLCVPQRGSLNPHLYWFPGATVTNDHILGVLKKRKIIFSVLGARNLCRMGKYPVPMPV